jgi:hypothetical protein
VFVGSLHALAESAAKAGRSDELRDEHIDTHRRKHAECRRSQQESSHLTTCAQRAQDREADTTLHTFQPDKKFRQLVLDTITAETQRHPSEDQERRREQLTQLDRLQDLYVLGDLTKPRYVMRRQTLEEELQRLAPHADPHLDRAQELLGDFATFWRAEPDPAERRKLLSSLFDHIWQDTGRIVAVTPRPAFAVYFKTIDQARPTPPKGRPKGGVTKAGATGVRPVVYPRTSARSRSGWSHRLPANRRHSKRANRMQGCPARLRGGAGSRRG